MNPYDIETMFEINPNDMPKMSSFEGGCFNNSLTERYLQVEICMYDV